MAISARDGHNSALGTGETGVEQQQRVPPLPIPPSPTLTNPDMILPFGSDDRESFAPSPPFRHPSLSHLQASYERLPNESSAGPAQAYSRLHNTPSRHMWLRDGIDATSRRLSDIGEEEASLSTHSRDPISTTTEDEFVEQAAYSRTESYAYNDTGAQSNSSSTVCCASGCSGTNGRRGYAAFRSADNANLKSIMQVPDSNSRDEGNNRWPNADNSMVPTVDESAPGEDFSSAILSSEAERILDNAKKRLTLMEGNLSKARSSVRLAASPLPSISASIHPLGLGQPVGGLYQSISRGERRLTAALRLRQMGGISGDSSSSQHSRVNSDLNLSAMTAPLASSDSKSMRSMSAMGSAAMSELYNDGKSFQYHPTRAYLTHRASVSMVKPAVDSINPPFALQEGSSGVQGLRISEDNDNVKISSVDEPNSVHQLSGLPERAQSQLQVRDLQDQMKGLHIKISTLKVKAQEDGLRRRSFQNLRTPTPLASEHNWYDNDLAYKDIRSISSKVSAEATQDASRSDTPTLEERATYNAKEETSDAINISAEETDVRSVEAGTDGCAHFIAESRYEDTEAGKYNDIYTSNGVVDGSSDDGLNETLEAFPPVPNSNEATPHEEREDAFDYEHFILHSALGNYAQPRLRRPSGSSTGSEETTRPTYGTSSRRSRSNSANSLSTAASFITATEGRGPGDDDLESVLYWDRRFNDELRSHDHYRCSEEAEDGQMILGSEKLGQSRDKSKKAAYSLWSPRSTGPARPELSGDDSLLLERLFQSLGKVCIELQEQTNGKGTDERVVQILRRRLDAARRTLDGGLDT